MTDHDPTPEEQEQLDALRRLASVLGAHLLIEHGDDVALATQRVAEDRGTTYVLMGTPKPRSALRRMTKPALPYRLLAVLPGVDLRIVADRTRRTEGGTMTALLDRPGDRSRGRRSRRSHSSATASRRPSAAPVHRRTRRILFPFIGGALSKRALDAALRLASAEDATVVPIFLARVPLHLPLDAPLPRQSRARDPAAGGDRAARDRVRRAGRRADRARAHLPPRAADRRSRTSATTGS